MDVNGYWLGQDTDIEAETLSLVYHLTSRHGGVSHLPPELTHDAHCARIRYPGSPSRKKRKVQQNNEGSLNSRGAGEAGIQGSQCHSSTRSGRQVRDELA